MPTSAGSAADNPLPFVPLIIIGAGRSGTNALRDVLTRLPGLETWPCDEINAIWRHGNVGRKDDEFRAEDATPEVRGFIRKAFVNFWKESGRPPVVVEKTCANALRIEFVNAVFPEAKFIHIVRSGPDVIASAVKRWRGEMELPTLPYYLAKLKYVPFTDLPRYAFSFASNRLALALGREKRFSAWGPRFHGLADLADEPIETICARQWIACTSRSLEHLAQLPDDRHRQVRYEEFTRGPGATTKALLDFLGLQSSSEQIAEAVALVKQSSVGKGHGVMDKLAAPTRQQVQSCMEELGYT